jgi:hypothetical protein
MDGAVHAWRRLVSVADAVDGAAASGRFSPRLVPALWAGLKLAAIGLVSPVVGVWVGARATANHQLAKEITRAFPDVLDAVMSGGVPPFPMARVARVDAAQRWFVVSDLHRMPVGHLDWPTSQGTRDLYDSALDHYAAGDWGLIENGDIEDYWLVGGSAYGVCYDLARMVGGLLPGRWGADLLAAVYAEHTHRILENYQDTFDRVRGGFLEPGRFVRVAGNHDDVYEQGRHIRALWPALPGVSVVDFVVLESGGAPIGVVFHGHQTDGWNGPATSNRIARFTTSFASALHDQTLVPVQPGLPGPAATSRLLERGTGGQLTRVNGLTGATIGLESLDEVLLFEACRVRWGGAARGDLRDGPWVVLGHTHIPLAAPTHPVDGGRWWRYRNGGSGITHRMLTGVEWDGTGGSPEVRLVGWVPDGVHGARRVVLDGDRVRPGSRDAGR